MNREGRGSGQIEVRSYYFPGLTEENLEKLTDDSQCPDRDSNQTPHERYRYISSLCPRLN
jgi:hypothetical protein